MTTTHAAGSPIGTVVERRLSPAALVARLVGYDQRAFFRNTARAFFSLAFPLLFLVVFNALNSDADPDDFGGVAYATWFLPGILAFGITSATFSNLAISVTTLRDQGVLKRLRGTPLPAWAYIVSRTISAMITALLLVVLTFGLGVVAYGVDLRWETVPGLVVTVLLGSAAFTALGIAVTAVIPNAEAAPAITNVLILPLTFLSGIWFDLSDSPAWITTVADLFPVRALAEPMKYAVHPASTGPGLLGRDLAVLAIWLVVGVVVSLRWFRWESKRR